MKKFILITAAALLALSCVEEGGTGPDPTYPEATTPANVLKNVEISFNQRNAILLSGMLSENFVFYFDPDDVGQNPPGGSKYVIPESWSYTEFWQAVGSLLEKAYSVSLRIPTGGVGTPGPEETTYDAKNINIKILVMVDELNGYLADAGYCNFRFERYGAKSGHKLWRLTDWWDNTATAYDENPGLTPGSLGKILALYK